jgi:hypothetical protein
MYRSVHESPDLSAVPAGLRPVVASCLAKDPGQRPTPGALLDMIAPSAGRYSPHGGRPPPPAYAPYSAVPLHQAPTEAAPAGDVPADVPAGDELAFMAVTPEISLLIDAVGVTVDLKATDLQFTWAEISTVEHTAQGPRHLGITVRLHDGTTHRFQLAARRRARLQEWLEDLPMILECFT